MAKSEAFNMDCMEAMKEYPDKYFDLAVVDPPYGDGVAERERERERRGGEVISSADCGRGTVSRTGGTWAEKFGKKSLSGTQPRNKNTSMNCSVSHATRSSGGAITSNFQ